MHAWIDHGVGQAYQYCLHDFPFVFACGSGSFSESAVSEIRFWSGQACFFLEEGKSPFMRKSTLPSQATAVQKEARQALIREACLLLLRPGPAMNDMHFSSVASWPSIGSLAPPSVVKPRTYTPCVCMHVCISSNTNSILGSAQNLPIPRKCYCWLPVVWCSAVQVSDLIDEP